MATPDVTVIVATYNRSAVLRHVLHVLCEQTYENWEAIVVGDGCTDGTEEVVRACGDQRLRFVNLPRNHGEQSAANNEGVRQARGRHVAFLNHDDFWRADHLQVALERLRRGESDLVYCWVANLLPDDTVVLLGVSARGRYTPAVVVPASAWVWRRELAERIGPWRSGWTTRLPPSQDWLWRAHRRGARLEELPRLSVLGLPSGARPGSYLDGNDGSHAQWRARIAANPSWPETLLASYVHAQASGGRLPVPGRPHEQLSWCLRNGLAAAAAGLGLHPLELLLAVRHPGRGGFLRWLRKRRGLPGVRNVDDGAGINPS